MSAEDDTFEIDIYGDEHPETDNAQADGHDITSHGNHDATASGAPQVQATGDEMKPEDEIDFDINDELSEEREDAAQDSDTTVQDAASTQQGTKRKAEDEGGDGQDQTSGEPADEGPADERPIDAGATLALKLAELHWWTTEEDLRQFCAHADAESELIELAFGEHKINGKSKGEAYLEFSSLQAATAAKREIARASQVKEESGLKKTPFTVFFTAGGNPFRTAQGSTGKKEFQQSTGRGGAYNSFNNNRGGFVGRGNFVNNNNHMNNGRGGFNGNNMMQNRATPPQQAGWGMNGMGGYGANPMMAAGFNNMAGMGGYGAMNRGGMMNGMGMMGRGGFPNMGMGMGMNMNMNMMGGQRGGMMGGGRGGANWGAGFQQGGFNGGGGGFGMQAQQPGGAQQGAGNKKMKMGE